VIDRAESAELLARAPYVRIGVLTEHGPTILPVNHVVHRDAVFFRTSPGSKLGAAARGGRVAVEADGGDVATRVGWSVVGHGTASIVTDEALLEELMALDFEPWTLPDASVFWIRIDLDDLDGRRIVRGPPQPPG